MSHAGMGGITETALEEETISLGADESKMKVVIIMIMKAMEMLGKKHTCRLQVAFHLPAVVYAFNITAL